MPFKYEHRTLKSHILRTDPKPTNLLLGEDHQSVLILRSLMKFGALLAAGVVIATSIVLKDVPLICCNLLLATVILGLQIYKIAVDDEERLRLIVELLLILGAAGIAAWLAYPLLISGPITYLTILVFANYIATVINVATYVSGFFSPFIVSCLEWLMYSLALKQKSNTSKFAIEKDTHLVLIENMRITYTVADLDQDKVKDNLVNALNASISFLDTKLKRVKSYFFSSEIYAEKISTLKKLIRQIRKGDLGDLLILLKRKRTSRIAKIQVIMNIKTKSDKLFSDLKVGDSQNAQGLEGINTFLKQYTHLSPILTTELRIVEKKPNTIKERQTCLNTTLKDAERYHREKFKSFDELLQPFAVNINIVKEPLPKPPPEIKFDSLP